MTVTSTRLDKVYAEKRRYFATVTNRTAQDDWHLRDCHPESGACQFESLAVELTFAEIFEDLAES